MSSQQLIYLWGKTRCDDYIPPMYAVHVTYLRALDDCCAECGCWKFRVCKRNIQLRIHREREDIDFLDGIYSPEEYDNFTQRLVGAFDSHDCPVFPWAFCCCMCLCPRPQRSAMQKVLDDENRRLKDVGLQWNFHGFSNYGNRVYGLALTWLPQVRPNWELANPHRRRVALAPYPYLVAHRTVKESIDKMAETRLATLGLSGQLNDPVVGTGGKILVNRWYWDESAFDPVKSGYPMGFDMNILTQFTPGQPPCFGQPMKWLDYSNQPPPTIVPRDGSHNGTTVANLNADGNVGNGTLPSSHAATGVSTSSPLELIHQSGSTPYIRPTFSDPVPPGSAPGQEWM